MHSRLGRKIAVVCALSALCVAIGFAVLYRSFAIEYHLRRLRTEPSALEGVLDATEGSSRGRALRRFIEDPGGADRLVEMVARSNTAPDGSFRDVSNFRGVVDPSAEKGLVGSFASFCEALRTSKCREGAPFRLVPMLYVPDERTLWYTGLSDCVAPLQIVGYEPKSPQYLAQLSRWLRFAVGRTGRCSIAPDCEYSVQALSPDYPLVVVVLSSGESE